MQRYDLIFDESECGRRIDKMATFGKYYLASEVDAEIDRLTHELKVSKEIQWAEKQILIKEIEKSTALQARIRELEKQIYFLINFIPVGWKVPLGWSQVVAQAEEALKGDDHDLS